MSAASRSASAVGSSGLRVKAFMRRWHLDHEIAAGRDCNGTAELALRARRLGELRTRRKVARSLRDLVDYVDHTGSRCSAPRSVAQPMAARFSRVAILELAERLETARSEMLRADGGAFSQTAVATRTAAKSRYATTIA